jgi:hypothetical protein
MAKVDYKTEKIPVSLTRAQKKEVEDKALELGISAPGLYRLLFRCLMEGKIRTEDLLNVG